MFSGEGKQIAELVKLDAPGNCCFLVLRRLSNLSLPPRKEVGGEGMPILSFAPARRWGRGCPNTLFRHSLGIWVFGH